jgi:uncharacterized protein DUF4365
MPRLPKRPASHVLEEQSRRAFKSALPSDWVIHDVFHDYGADFVVEVYESSLPTGNEFLVQLKALHRKEAHKPFAVTIATATINYLVQRSLPAMIVGYDAQSRMLYYTWLDEYLSATELSHAKRKAAPKHLRIVFPDTAGLTASSIEAIRDYFRPAGVSSERVLVLLQRLSLAPAAERQQILQELRFLRTSDGVLYLLRMLPMDAILESTKLVEISSGTIDAFLEVCFYRPTPAAIMLFWGLAAHLALGEENSYTQMAHRLFDPVFLKVQAMSPKILATETHRLFGLSAETGIRKMAQGIQNSNFSNLVEVLCNRLHAMSTTAAPVPSAPDLYALLYAVEIVNNTIVSLSDFEMAKLWECYEKGREEMRILQKNPEEMWIHARGYLKALNQVFGFQFHLEHESTDEEAEHLLTCMAAKKVDLFTALVGKKERDESQDRTDWSRSDLLQYAMADLFAYTRMYWFGEALDWFRLPCFCREFFLNGR